MPLLETIERLARDKRETRERQERDQRETRERKARDGAMVDGLTQTNKIAEESYRVAQRARKSQKERRY